MVFGAWCYILSKLLGVLLEHVLIISQGKWSEVLRELEDEEVRCMSLNTHTCSLSRVKVGQGDR